MSPALRAIIVSYLVKQTPERAKHLLFRAADLQELFGQLVLFAEASTTSDEDRREIATFMDLTQKGFDMIEAGKPH